MPDGRGAGSRLRRAVPDTVGWICVAVGILGLVIAVATMRQGRDTTIVEEPGYDA